MYLVLLHQLEKGISLRNLWNVTEIQGKGVYFDQHNVKVYLFGRSLKRVGGSVRYILKDGTVEIY